MRRRHLVLAPIAAVAGGIALAPRGDSPRLAAPSPSPEVRGPAAPGRAGGDLVPRTRYRLSYEQNVIVAGQPRTTILTAGTWTTTPRADGRVEVRFAQDSAGGSRGELPSAEDLAAPAQLVIEDGVLIAMGFPAAMPVRARKLLTGLATTFQYTDRPVPDWSVSEEDLTGRYDAAYHRTGDEVERSRPRYTALRGESGLSASEAGSASPAETTRFRVDARGVVTAAVELDVAFGFEPGIPSIAMGLRARLERAAIEHVPAPDGVALAAAPISGHADFDGARRDADENLVAGAGFDDVLGEMQQIAVMSAKEASNPRAQAMARLAALIRLEPDIAAKAAAWLREHPARVAEARMLAGALATAEIAEGTDALAGLMKDGLPDDTHGVVVAALSFAEPATPASLRALAQGLDQAHADQAALGLGVQGRKARLSDPAAADAATGVLLERYARASAADRAVYLRALGNGGHPRALQVLRAAVTGGDPRLAEAAIFSLRFVPGPDADTLLEQAIARPELAFAAIRAAGFRDPGRWRARLLAAQEQYPEHSVIQTEIRTILRGWS